MSPGSSKLLLTGVIASILAGCGGGGGSGAMMSGTPPVSTPQNTNVSLLLSDASTEDWAMIGVKVLSIALVPSDGSANVTVYTAPNPAPTTNLVALDNIGELLANATLSLTNPMTFSGAVLSVSANPGDVLLNVAADPEAGFAGTPGAAIPASAIQIQHTTGTAPNLTAPINVSFVKPVTVTPGMPAQLDVEFDLAHPALIVAHTPPGTTGTTWAVNFDGPVHHHPLGDITRLVLRHLYGDVASIATDNTSITVNREFPTEPVVTPETAVASGQSVQVLADATNGTLFYDVDAQSHTTVMSFATLPTLVGKQVRIAARYQQDGTLVATRIWASSAFDKVWLSPEGHVLHVDSSANVVTIENESGQGVPVTVNAATQIYYRAPQDALADATPISTNGAAFLASSNLVRGFKVHATVVDPLATPLVAQSIDIENAAYDGVISMPSMTAFTYTHAFRTASDDYTVTLPYIGATTPNGKDPLTGAAISGYKWWYFAYPTALDESIGDWISATNGAVNFGLAGGAVPTRGVSTLAWNDPANPNGWSARASVILPSALPLGMVATGLSQNAFTMTVSGGTTAATIDVGTAAGSATLVYQVDKTGGIVSVSPVDVTSAAGLATLTTALTSGTPVKVYGVPEVNGNLRAYVLAYFTGSLPKL